MSLADDIRMLRDRTLGALAAAHDYYVDAKTAWEIVDEVISAGRVLNITNPATGTVTTSAGLLAKMPDYISVQLRQSTFQQFISIFESFFFDFLRLWLTAYPYSLGNKKLDYKTVLDAGDIDAVTQLVVGKELNDVLYERPAGWFAYMEEKAKLGCPAADEIGRFAEAKATRDVLVHNMNVAGPAYVAKAGAFARHAAGDWLEVPEAYHQAVWELVSKIVADVSAAALAKVP